MATKNDKTILNLKKQIEEKKKLLNSSTKFVPVTNCSFDYQGSRINIHVATKEQLLMLIAVVKSLELALKQVLPEEKLIISGYSSSEWLEDFTNKFNSLNLTLEKERLKKLEDKLHSLLSVDTKIELEIEELKSLI